MQPERDEARLRERRGGGGGGGGGGELAPEAPEIQVRSRTCGQTA